MTVNPMKTYKINEIFYSIQGEGFHAGRPAVFIRFAECSMRCDPRHEDYNSFVELNAEEILGIIIKTIKLESTGQTTNFPQHAETLKPYELYGVPVVPEANSCPMIIFTGGEPALQLDNDLIAHLTTVYHSFCVESYGSVDIRYLNVDFISVSPLPETETVMKDASEIKVVYPNGLDPHDFDGVEYNYCHRYIQPFCLQDDHIATRENLGQAIDFVMKNPRWRLSSQLQKFYCLQ